MTTDTETPEVHAMVDLETLGVGGDAAIAQAGVVFFDPYAPAATGELPEGASWETTVNVFSCLMAGGAADPKTVDWWRARPAADRQLLGTGGMSIGLLLDTLQVLWVKHRPAALWCHGATFDAPILQGYYARLGLPCPWPYWAVRDTRTLFWLAERAGWVRKKDETAHLALADAIAQARDVQSALRWLGNMERVTPVGAISVS